jgi:hypothetical protein
LYQNPQDKENKRKRRKKMALQVVASRFAGDVHELTSRLSNTLLILNAAEAEEEDGNDAVALVTSAAAALLNVTLSLFMS